MQTFLGNFKTDSTNEEKRFIWVTQPTVNGTDTYQQSAPMSNGTQSETLTRLQTGYLRAIFALETRIKSLQQDLNIARASQGYQNLQGSKEAAQRISNLEERNDLLQRDLNIARARPEAVKQDICYLETQLTAKNYKIKEKNTQVLERDQTIRTLQQQLKQEQKKRTGPNPANDYIRNLQSQLTEQHQILNAKHNQNISLSQENERLQAELTEKRRSNRGRGAVATPSMAAANNSRWTGSAYERNSNAQGSTGNSSHAQKKRKFEGAPGSQDNPLEL